MDNDIQEVNVYTIDGQVFTLDKYYPNLYKGVKEEQYSDRKITKQFSFNGDWIVCHELVTIQYKDGFPRKERISTGTKF